MYTFDHMLTLQITMYPWITIALSLCFCIALIKLTTSRKNRRLPPGPPAFFILAKLIWEQRSVFEFEDVLRQLHLRYGPIINLRITSQPAIFISDRRLAHKALVQKGAAFADRPPEVYPGILLSSNKHDISSGTYGPLWRLLRRNLASNVLHPSCTAQFAPARKWVLSLLIDRLRAAADGIIVPVHDFEYAMFSLLVLMCFGEKPEEKVMRDIAAAERYLLLNYTKFNVFEFFPKITKILFRKRWNEIVAARRKLEEIFLPLIRTREQGKHRYDFNAYVDSLLGLELPEPEGRKLSGGEMVSLCSEFLSAGTETSTTALQWVMAELVRDPDIQSKLAEEVEAVVRVDAELVEEDDLNRMPYLKAVVKELLRRHPPTHFLLPHAVAEDVELDGYIVPKGAMVNFEITRMNWDGEVWDDPLTFRPERFVEGGEGVEVDITGSKEVRMMPFGAGRRICPGLGLAVLHLEYFVANLVRAFEWKAVEGEEVEMTEKLEFTVVMKKPLRVRVLPRRIK